MIFLYKKCLMLHANSKTQANLGFFGGKKGQIGSLLPVCIYLKIPCK